MKAIPSLHPGLVTAALAASWLLFSGCANLCSLRDPRTGQAIPEEFTGTLGIAERPSTLPQPALLRSVETRNCRSFDRILFTFQGEAAPGFKVEYIDKPVRRCASGEAVPVAGDAWLEVSMLPAQAHNDQGQPTISNRNRQLNYPNLRELVETCDFEGHETWVLGLGSPNRFRVTELVSPPRIVIDVKH